MNTNKTDLMQKVMEAGQMEVVAAASILGIAVDTFLRKARRNKFDLDDIILIADACEMQLVITGKGKGIMVDPVEYFANDGAKSRRVKKYHDAYLKGRKKRIEELRAELDALEKEMKDE